MLFICLDCPDSYELTVYCYEFAGLRHISLLKLVGKPLDDTSGVLELYPINGEIVLH